LHFGVFSGRLDVTTTGEAKIAQAVGAVAVMALERVPSDICKQGGVARMSDPKINELPRSKLRGIDSVTCSFSQYKIGCS
jgi:pyridoxal biosynthesis lyase PdxS